MNNLRNHLLTYIGANRRFSYTHLSRTLSDLKIKHTLPTLRKEFSLAKKDELVEFEKYYHKQIPVLSNKGKLAIKTQLPFKKYSEWDGRWRLVTLDLPQSERPYRRLLEKELNRLGFAQVQKNTYLSPYPLLNFINRTSTDLGIRQYLILAEANEIKDLDNILKHWPIKEINLEYKKFIKKARKASPKNHWPLMAKQLEWEFVEIYSRDPHLPAELLPKDWQGEAAHHLFKQISNSY